MERKGGPPPQEDQRSTAERMSPVKSNRLKRLGAAAIGALAIGGGAPKPVEAQGFDIKGALTGLAVDQLVKAKNKKEAAKYERQDKERTKEANKGRKWPSLRGKLVHVLLPSDNTVSNFPFSGNLEDLTVKELERTLRDLGARVVIQGPGLEQTTNRRQSERGNEEVKQSTVPAKGNIVRGQDFELELGFVYNESDKQNNVLALLSNRGLPADVFYTGREKQVLSTMTLRDAATQENIDTLLAFGGNRMIDNYLVTAGPFAAYGNRSDDERQQLRALTASVINSKEAITAAVAASEKPAPPAKKE